jgi:membrane fusion protein (multidrug efflux system)
MTDFTKYDYTLKTKIIMKKNFLLPALMLMILAGCGAQSESTETENGIRERVVTVGTMTIDSIAFEDRIRINGNVAASEDAMISAETPGQVLYVAERGTVVRKGDVILRLDDRLLKSGYEAAKTGFDLAETLYQRQAALYADSVISTIQYLQTKAQRDQASSQLASIKKQLEDAELRAPFSGRIEERMTSVGQFVGPGMPVLRLVNTSNVKITGGVPERYAGKIKQNTPVEVNFRSYNLPPRLATVRFAGNLINPDSRTFPVEIILDNPDNAIKPLMVVELRVLRDAFDGSLVIPRTAVSRDDNGLSVFVVETQGEVKRAKMRPIEISLSSGDFVIIGSGIEAGEEIIVTGLTNLGDGDLINITSSTSNNSLLTASR